MELRIGRATDMPKIEALCKEYDINVPENPAIIFVAEDEKGEIVGMIGLKTIYQVEPRISKNPLVGYGLWKMLDGVIQANNLSPIRGVVGKGNEKYIKSLEKEGFRVIDTERIILEK